MFDKGFIVTTNNKIDYFDSNFDKVMNVLYVRAMKCYNFLIR